MVHLPISHPSARAASGLPSLASTAVSRVVEFLQILAAAVRAARAAEARRDPSPADMKLLGITGKLPKTW
jgi:hypothetical protein